MGYMLSKLSNYY